MPKPFLISVIICTLNRAKLLSGALQSLLNQTLSDDCLEIVVVDNGSTDNTRSVVNFWASQNKASVRYAYHAVPGLSHARNHGIAIAASDILVFMDDDALADPNWLAEILRTFRDHPLMEATGGRILPMGQKKIPDWLPLRLYSHLSLLDYGPVQKTLTYPRYLFGTNMAIRRRAFKKVGGFNDDLGRQGPQSMVTAEETEFFLRLERSGGRIFYNPSIVVNHLVTPERLNPDWIMKQSYWIGMSSALMEKLNMSRWRVVANAITAPALLVFGTVGIMCSRVLDYPGLKVFSGCLFSNRLGYLHGIFHSRIEMPNEL